MFVLLPGVFGFPNDQVAKIAARSVSAFLANSNGTTLTQIYFVDVRPEMVSLLIKAFSEENNLQKRANFYGNKNREVIGMEGADKPPSPEKTPASPQRSPQKVPEDPGKKWPAHIAISPVGPATTGKAWPATPPTAESMSFVSTRNGKTKIHVLEQDITELQVDVIVNSSNHSLTHKAGVSKAIERAAGHSMQRECRNYVATNGQLRIGEHAKTGPGNLKCSMVFHAVGPIYNLHDREAYKRDLTATVAGCLDDAKSIGYDSIAFPSIGSGKL